MDRKLYPVLLLALVVVPFIVLAQGCTAWMQNRRLAEAVPDFACSGLAVNSPSASFSWSGRQRSGYSSLRMPAECRARLERIVSQQPYAAGEFCMPRSRCRELRVDGRTYMFEFSEDRVGFRYSYAGAD
ncbi:MAG TPA: hypothetical protein VF552_03740 [Allosphingosinicella sp.]|jgi:hypothetical protein